MPSHNDIGAQLKLLCKLNGLQLLILFKVIIKIDWPLVVEYPTKMSAPKGIFSSAFISELAAGL